MIRQFKLKQEQEQEQEEERKPARLEQTSEMQYDQPAEVVSEKPAASAGNIFTCIPEGEESSSSGEFEYVWVAGRLEKRVKKNKKKGKGMKCKLVQGGMLMVKSMEKKLKAISKDLKRFSRILGQFSSPAGGR